MNRKRCTSVRLAASATALVALLCSGASAAPSQFAFSYSSADNPALVQGFITVDDAVLPNPGAFFGLDATAAGVLQLTVVVSEATIGNGTFDQGDFTSYAWDTAGVTLDFSQELLGQATAGQPWGTQDGTSGDFNLFGAGGSGAPTGSSFFQLTTGNGTGDPVHLDSMVPVAADIDTDGLSNHFELANGLDPRNPDSNGNGVPDGREDSDNDGLSDLFEQRAGTNPLLADTDADGLSDGEELATGVFAAARNVTTSLQRPRAVHGADFDGDGDADVVALSNSDQSLVFYRNLGGAGFAAGAVIEAAPVPPLPSGSGCQNVLCQGGLASADLDGDGDLDLLAGAFLEDQVLWYENLDGHGGFGPAQLIYDHVDVRGISLPRDVDAADLDGDGDMDVFAAVNDVDGGVFWFRNDGAGTFASGPLRISTDFSPFDTKALDIDGDGDLDMVVLNSNDNTYWYPNNDGLGSFGARRTITNTLRAGAAVDGADLDGDGDIDLVTASHSDDRITSYDNTDGSGTFGVPRRVSGMAALTQTMVVADINADGAPDIVSGAENGVVWYPNIPVPASFAVEQGISIATAVNALEVVAVDMDADGDLDVLAALVINNAVVWYENTNVGNPLNPDTDGDGLLDGFEVQLGFDPLDPDENQNGVLDGDEDLDGDGLSNSQEAASGTDPRLFDSDADGVSDSDEVALGLDALSADTDGDEMPDGFELAFAFDPKVADENANQILDGRDDSDGDGLGNGQESLAGTNPRVTDTDDDGLTDGEELGTGVFVKQQVKEFDGSRDSTVEWRDVDGDHLLDLVTYSSTKDTLSWLRNNGTGGYDLQPLISQFELFKPRSLDMADFDGDGDADILVGTDFGQRVVWYRNNGSGQFGSALQIVQDSRAIKIVRAGDLDGDGDVDVLSYSLNTLVFTDGELRWFANDGAGNFSAPMTIPTTGQFFDLVLADIDRNGSLDLLVTDLFDNTVFVRSNDGTGVFGARQPVVADRPGVFHSAAADIDGDGQTDIVTSGTDALVWFRNTGNLTFAPPITVATGGFGGRDSVPLIADVDGDGDADVVASDYGVPGVSNGNGAAWHENLDGLGTFSPDSVHQFPGLSFPTEHLVAADVDGDSDIDLAATQGGEVRVYTQTNIANPTLFDTDGDGLGDGQEVNVLGTNPLLADTDGDFLPDGFEVAFDFDPLNADENGNNQFDGFDDADMDGLTNVQEAGLCFDLADTTTCTNPRLADTDGDGLSDFLEVDVGLNPRDATSTDIQPPVTTATVANANGGAVVQLACTDVPGVGCLESRYACNDGDPNVTGVCDTPGGDFVLSPGAPIPVAENTVLRYFSTDRVFNQEAEQRLVGTRFASLALDLTSRGILQEGSQPEGFQLDAPGSLKVPGSASTSLTLAGIEIELRVLGETGTPLQLRDPAGNPLPQPLTTRTDSEGFFNFANLKGFSLPGVFSVQARFAGTALLAPADARPLSLLVGQSAGYALLVQGRIPNGEGALSHDKSARRVYDTLVERGYDPDNIIYLSYTGFNDPGRPEVDGLPSRQTLREAFGVCRSEGLGTDGAPCGPPQLGLCSDTADPASCTPLGERMAANPAPLLTVFVDHGTAVGEPAEPKFHLNTEVVTPAELDTWLSTLEQDAELDVATDDKDRILVLGYCYSGSFLEPLFGGPTATGRVVISSATATEESYRGLLEPLAAGEVDDDNDGGLRPGEFFLEEMFQELGRGTDVLGSFIVARDKTEAFTRIGDPSQVTAPFFDGARQHPLLEDDGVANGEGRFGSNDIIEGFGDGSRAARLFLGIGGVTNSAELPADVVAVTPTRFLDAQSAGTLLTAQVNDNQQVLSSVFLEIRAPGKVLPPVDPNREASLQRDILNDLQKLTTFLSNGQWQRFEGTFAKPGLYEVFYTVRDVETFKVSPARRSVVYKDFAGNLAPSPFNLVSPISPAGGVITAIPTSGQVFEWQPTTDPVEAPCPITLNCAEGVTYSLVINSRAANGGVGTEVFRLEELTVPFAPVGQDAGLVDGQRYLWSVTAVDGFGARRVASNLAQGEFQASNNNSFGGPDLLVTQQLSPLQPRVGDQLAFAITVRNRGGDTLDTANNVTVTNLLPTGVDFVSGSGCQFDPASRKVSCSMGTLGKDQQASVTLMVQAQVATVLTNAVTVLAAEPDDNYANNVSQAMLTVMAPLPPPPDPDADEDGVPDATDNCPADANAGQENLDGDPLGDVCDPDIDGDGFSNQEEIDLGSDPRDASSCPQVFCGGSLLLKILPLLQQQPAP